MRKKKKKLPRIFIGDLVKTNSSFNPKENKGLNTSYEKLKGFVVSRRGDHYGVRFGGGLPFTNHLDGLLSKPVGYLLTKGEFDLIEY